MKKYLAAAAVALTVFAMSAFAAELIVDGGVVQAGTDADLTCSDGVTVTNYGVEADDGNVYFAKLSGLDECLGEKVIIDWYDTSDVRIEHQVSGPLDASDIDVDGLYRYDFDTDPAAADIDRVDVYVHSGS